MNSEQNNLGGPVDTTPVATPPVDGTSPSPVTLGGADQVAAPAEVNPLAAPVEANPMAAPMETAPVDPMAPADPNMAPTLDAANPAPGLVIEPMPGAEAIQPYSEPPVEEPKKKNKALIIIIAVVAVLVLAIGGYAAYIFFLVDPAKVHKEVITEVFNSASEMVLSAKPERNYTSIRTQGDLKIETGIEELEFINNYKISYVVGLDNSNNKAEVGLGLTEKDQEVINAMLYYLEDTAYLESTDLYDEIISLGTQAMDMSAAFETADPEAIDDLNLLITKTRDYLIASFDESKYSRKLESVTFNGNKQQAFNNSYRIDEATFYSMLRSLLTSYRADTEVVELLAVYAEADVEEIQALLDSLIQSLTDPELSNDGGVIYFNVYTSMLTNKLVGVKIYADTTAVLEYYKNGNQSVTTIGDEVSKIVITSTENNTEFKYSDDEGQTLTLSIVKENENKTNVMLSMPVTSGDIAGNLQINASTEVKKTGDTEEANMTIQGVLTLGEESYDLKLIANTITEYDVSIADVNTKGAVDINMVDEAELSNNLLEALEGTDFYDLLIASMGDISGGLDDDYDDDYSDDDYSDIYIEDDPNCKYAQCGDCTDDICDCIYYDEDFNEHDVMCPNPNL